MADRQRRVAWLMSCSKGYASKGRWDLAYVYANEASHLSANNSAAVEAQRAIQCALYKLMPLKRCSDKMEFLLDKAKECIAREEYKEAVRLSNIAYQMQGVKTPAPLGVRAEAYGKMFCYALSYADANEALLLTSDGFSTSLTGLLRDALVRLSGYSLHFYDENDLRVDTAGLNAQLASSSAAPAYYSRAWPNRVKVRSLDLIWAAEGSSSPYSRGGPNSSDPMCMMEEEDGCSYLEPPVRFTDLQKFFFDHTEYELKEIRLFVADGDGPTTGLPTQAQVLKLLEVVESTTRAGKPSPFSRLEFARLYRTDFYNVSADAFRRLLMLVLAAGSYQFFDLKRLPAGITPRDFLTHPALLAARDAIEFSLGSLSHPPGLMEAQMRRCDVVKFDSESVIAHLKGRLHPVPGGMGLSSRFMQLTFSYQPVPGMKGAVTLSIRAQLYLHETYLREGVMALLEAIKRDFFESNSVQRPRFCVAIFFSSPGTGRDACGTWQNRQGEQLRIIVPPTSQSGGSTAFQQRHGGDQYQVVVERNCSTGK